jgi:hypothetical protein
MTKRQDAEDADGALMNAALFDAVQRFRLDGSLFFVGAASFRDRLNIAAGCRSYKK